MTKKIYIINANYYEEISDRLVDGAKNFLNENDIDHEIVNVPGALEIPTVINLINNKINADNFDIGFIAIGCVIRGKTAHFDLISRSVIDAIMNISVESKKPVGNCILTCFNYKQAVLRKNKGKEAAFALNSILYK